MATKTIKIGLSDADKAAMTATIKGNALGLIADAYSTSGTYAVGDLVYYNNVLYKCKTAISTAESWTAAHWEATSIEEESKNKLSKGDFDGTTGVGYADVAKSLETSIGIDDQTPFSFTTVGIDSDVETGIQELKKLVCVDVVRNQLIPLVRLPSTETQNGVTLTNNNDGSVTLNGTATADCDFSGTYFALAPVGHKVMFNFGNAVLSTSTIFFSLVNIDNSCVKPLVREIFNTISKIDVIVKSGTVLSNVKLTPCFIDLTQCYGSNEVVNAIIGNDSSKYVERLLAFDPAIINDTDYDAGTLVPSQSAKLKIVDYNLLKDDWTVTGNNVVYVEKTLTEPIVCTGQVISMVANVTGAIAPLVSLYENNTQVVEFFLNQTAPNGQKYGKGKWLDDDYALPIGTKITKIRFRYDGSGGTSGNFTFSNISIFNWWDGSRIGYEPYEEHIIDLPNYEGHGVLKVVNGKVVADGTELYPDGNSKKRYGVVDLGTLNWEYVTSEEPNYFRSTTSLDRPFGSGVGTMLCAKYTVVAYRGGENASIDKRISPVNLTNDNRLAVRDTAYTDAATFKSAMSGVYLAYELATEEDIETAPYNGNPYMDDFGTMSFLDGNGNTIAGLQGCEIFYKANVAGLAESLYAKTDGDPDAVALVDDVQDVDDKHDAISDQLKEALGGTLRQLLALKTNIDFDDTAWVDLGELSWSRSTSGSNPFFFATISNIKSSAVGNTYKALNTKLVQVNPTAYADINPDITLQVRNQEVQIRDDSYTDAATFKAAMKNVLLAYEKA